MSIIAIIAGLTFAGVTGWLLTRRSGELRATTPGAAGPDLSALGLATDGPTVVHFSAPWCGPCVGVRRVVDQVCGDLDVAHVEIDLDANPAAARSLSVLSLPTTFIFDAAGQQRFRAAGVPTATDLRSALKPLLA
ncbi:thioredoxin family protein [Mycobacterium sp. M1]|uniref:Thioredoxin family protein n=1 Tax=Mycolicibacter acidiphilus TaxID=2835306 RepID=A0ABS5RHL7_9MYCO|nr:thioredoxin family protein [Mycolicibacter acidiphilus]MBS9532444.1 thioredoxin family protein [Mycolicibacter acidiphilus]